MYPDTNFQKGRFYESLCAAYLERSGYKVLRQNWYCRWGEIDIISRKGDELIFVEVKSVSSTKMCRAVDLFNVNKKRRLLRAINYFLLKNKIKSWKLDLVCFTKDGSRLWIEHYKDVLSF